jgi:hypothetical protein
LLAMGMPRMALRDRYLVVSRPRRHAGRWTNDERGISIGGLARKARDLAHRKVSTKSDLDAMGDIAARVEAIIDERNLAVHGFRSLQPDEILLAAVARGKYKNTLQLLSLIRLRSLNAEVGRIIAVIELADHGVIEGVTATSRRYRSPNQP